MSSDYIVNVYKLFACNLMSLADPVVGKDSIVSFNIYCDCFFAGGGGMCN